MKKDEKKQEEKEIDTEGLSVVGKLLFYILLGILIFIWPILAMLNYWQDL